MYLKEVANPAMSMGNFLPPLPPAKPVILFVLGSSIGEEIPKGLKRKGKCYQRYSGGHP